MAKENGEPTAAEKGKGKAEDEKPLDVSKKIEETKKDKDGKPIANGKKGDEPLEGKYSIIRKLWCHGLGLRYAQRSLMRKTNSSKVS